MKKREIVGFFLVYFLFLSPVLTAAETLTLEKAIGEARSKSLVLKQSGEMVWVAEAGSAEQRTYLLPSFSFSGDVANDVNTLTLAITQPIFTGGRLLGQYQIARLAIDFARASYDVVYLDLILNVKNAYFNALRLEKAVNVSRELVDNRRRHSSEVEKRVQVGVLPKVEQLKTEVELAHSEDALILAENGLKAARSTLNRLLERSLETEVILEDVPLDVCLEDKGLEYYYAQAQKNRPERKAAAIKVGQAEEVLRIQSIRFKEGMTTSTEVLDADFALARARTDHYNASYDYLSAEAVLKRAVGQK